MIVDVEQPLAWTVEDVLREERCRALVARIDEENPQVAPITTADGFVMRTDIRNNERIVFDDEALATEIYAQLLPGLPKTIFGRVPVGNNERFRCYRYKPGMQFKMHRDGAFVRNDDEASALTVLVYLNSEFEGGATRFFEVDLVVQGRPGLALLFQHRLLHEGEVVTAGAKYVLRTDVMYRSP